MIANRSAANFELDARNLVFALNLAARRLKAQTMSRLEYDRTRELILDDAHSGRRSELEAQLPTLAQIERHAAGEWEVALAAAGLQPRGQLTAAGEAFAETIRNKARICAFEDERRQRTSRDRRTKRTVVGTRPAPAHGDGPSGPLVEDKRGRGGRRGNERTHRRALTVAEAMAIFAETQKGWPADGRVLDCWAKTIQVSVKDHRRGDWERERRQAQKAVTDKERRFPTANWDGATSITTSRFPPGFRRAWPRPSASAPVSTRSSASSANARPKAATSPGAATSVGRPASTTRPGRRPSTAAEASPRSARRRAESLKTTP